MSQCCKRKRWIALIGGISLLSNLVSCSVAELEKFALENADQDQEITYKESAKLPTADKSDILQFERSIEGGKYQFDSAMGVFARMLIGEDDEIRFQNPVAVGGAGDKLYIVDAGPRIVYIYDLKANTIHPLNAIGPQFIGAPGNIFVASDYSMYIVDALGKQVHHFSQDGQLISTYKDLSNLSRPIDVWVDEQQKLVYVADGSFSHIVVFDDIAKAVRAIGRRGNGPGRFRAITSFTKGAEGLYVVDRMELPVQVLGDAGDYKYSFGEFHQVYPSAIAVSEDQRVFVADRSDNTIRVYKDAELLAVVGGNGSAPGRFRRITSLWAHAGNLYVADSLNRRIQILKIKPSFSGFPAVNL